MDITMEMPDFRPDDFKLNKEMKKEDAVQLVLDIVRKMFQDVIRETPRGTHHVMGDDLFVGYSSPKEYEKALINAAHEYTKRFNLEKQIDYTTDHMFPLNIQVLFGVIEDRVHTSVDISNRLDGTELGSFQETYPV